MQTKNSSMETDNSHRTNNKYNNMDAKSTPTNSCKMLYEMKALKPVSSLWNSQKWRPSKIHFQFYRPSRQPPRKIPQFRTKKRKSQRRIFETLGDGNIANTESPLLKRLPLFLDNLSKQNKLEFSTSKTRQLCIYCFDLYSLFDMPPLGVLNMASDYFLKPLLTVVLNGFIQPLLTFCFNILSSLRDVQQPIADTLNNFMKPLATVGGSLRLTTTTYNKHNIRINV